MGFRPHPSVDKTKEGEMENISIGNIGNTQPLAGYSAARTADQAADANVQRVVQPKEPAETNLSDKNPDQARFEAVKRAAQAIASNPFPVSDTKFTIYKESVGGGGEDFVFITRFTSLVDGKVTIVPEGNIFAAAGNNGQGTILDGTV